MEEILNMSSIVVILRHNIRLDTDVDLAVREFDSLMNTTGTRLTDICEVASLLPLIGAIDLVLYTKNTSTVAVHYNHASRKQIVNLAFRSAFAQEIFVIGNQDFLVSVADSMILPHHLVNELCGQVLIVLPLYYLIETESVGETNKSRTRNNLEQIGRMLLTAYTGARMGGVIRTLRHAKKTTLSLTHDLHIYKAKFFPRMVRALLNIFARERSTVIDPFCGSGTALLEASLLGHRAYGMDIDPICQLISAAKVTPFLDRDTVVGDVTEFHRRLVQAKSATAAARRAGEEGFPAILHKKLLRRDIRDDTFWTDEVIEDVGALRLALQSYSEEMRTCLPRVLASDAVTKKIRYRYVGVGNGRYTIEVVKVPIIDRISDKIERCRMIAETFDSTRSIIPWNLGKVSALRGDARHVSTWPANLANVIITSPPYLPASSGREHYATSRGLAFHTLGISMEDICCHDSPERLAHLDDGSLDPFPEAMRLLDYLKSDAKATDPQRDPMRYERKARPTKMYIEDMLHFFTSAKRVLANNGILLLVVASQHVFYSHRRNEIEHIVNCATLYRELAESCGLTMREEIRMELLKAANTRARPRAKDRYFESILVFS